MHTVKPPYKFRSPYWTNDELGKQGIKYRFEIIDSRKDTAEIVAYYKNCIGDVSNTDLYKAENSLEMLIDKKFESKLKESFESMLITGRSEIWIP